MIKKGRSRYSSNGRFISYSNRKINKSGLSRKNYFHYYKLWKGKGF